MKNVKAKITRTVTEIAILKMNDREDADSAELIEVLEELDTDGLEVVRIIDVISQY